MTGFCSHGVRLDHECTACLTTPGGVTVSGDQDLGGAAALRAEEARRDVPERPTCAGLPIPVADFVPACGLFAAHHPHLIGESVAYRGKDAPEHTGVSDVQAALAEIVNARHLAFSYGLASEALGAAKPGAGRNEMVGVVRGARDRLAESFERIEALVRGEQR